MKFQEEFAKNDNNKKAFTQKGRPYLLFSTLPYYTLLFSYYLSYMVLKDLQNPFYIAILIYVFFPLADLAFTHDWLSPDREQIKALEKDIFFKIPLYMNIFADWALNIWVLHQVSTQPISILTFISMIFAIGTGTSTIFMMAHELFHKRGIDRFVGTLSLSKHMYMHFLIEHNYGHHKRVATLEDPATSRYGETIYQFIVRSAVGGYLSAWQIENDLLTRVKGHKHPWVWQNRMIWFNITNLLILFAVYYFYSWKGLSYYILLTALTICYVEAINYIEHYGLLRKKVNENEYEKVNITHSWNAPHRITNYVLFKLQRHSDHHENPYKPYQILETHEESPMLPHGYSLSLILAFFPQTWFKIMHPILEAYQKGEKISAEKERMINIESMKIIGSIFAVFAIGAAIVHMNLNGQLSLYTF